MTKPWFRSLTIWSLLCLLAGYILAAFQDGGVSAVFADPDVGRVVALLLQTFGWGGALLGRVRATVPVRLPLGITGDRGSAPVVALGLLTAGGLAVMVGLAGALGGCAQPQRCPDDQGVVATYRQGPPSSLTARCTGDPEHVSRRTLEAPAAGRFVVLCRSDELPGPRPGTVSPVPCGEATCTSAELTCVPWSHTPPAVSAQPSATDHAPPRAPDDLRPSSAATDGAGLSRRPSLIGHATWRRGQPRIRPCDLRVRHVARNAT